eukprot:Gregarina_sp_Poly_1__11340@NODE_952_length_5572_cov_61_818892_g676_i0_p2_GENE_NODE_952_length_5572_cov_61_818892_g676_i0NODE_952_length_5572_cov_61_818892_g676_i0_p2_ORF_typecomplete_len566_score45_09_NODE_952_length_5572_cov_61_818892_g676_i021699
MVFLYHTQCSPFLKSFCSYRSNRAVSWQLKSQGCRSYTDTHVSVDINTSHIETSSTNSLFQSQQLLQNRSRSQFQLQNPSNQPNSISHANPSTKLHQISSDLTNPVLPTPSNPVSASIECTFPFPSVCVWCFSCCYDMETAFRYRFWLFVSWFILLPRVFYVVEAVTRIREYNLVADSRSRERLECMPAQCLNLPEWGLLEAIQDCVYSAAPGCAYSLNVRFLGTEKIVECAMYSRLLELLPMWQPFREMTDLQGEIVFDLPDDTHIVNDCAFWATASLDCTLTTSTRAFIYNRYINATAVRVPLENLALKGVPRYIGFNADCELHPTRATFRSFALTVKILAALDPAHLTAEEETVYFLSFRPVPESPIRCDMKECRTGPFTMQQAQHCASTLPPGCLAEGTYVVSGSMMDNTCADEMGPNGSLRTALNTNLLHLFGNTTAVHFENPPVVNFYTAASVNCMFNSFSIETMCPIPPFESSSDQNAVRLPAGARAVQLPDSFIPVNGYVALQFDGPQESCGTGAWLQLQQAIVSFQYYQPAEPPPAKEVSVYQFRKIPIFWAIIFF